MLCLKYNFNPELWNDLDELIAWCEWFEDPRGKCLIYERFFNL